MEKKIFIFLVALLACVILLDSAISQAKIGVIIHDHGAPGKYDSTQDPYLAHDDNAYYGVKQFLRHLIMMKVIPNIVICADLHGDSDSCDGNTYYAPEDYYKGFYNANYECVEQGGGSGGLNCYRDGDCDAPDTCKVSLNLEDSTSTATDQGASDAYLTDTTQDFSPYKDGNHVILAGIGAGNWWGFIGTEPLGDDTTVYIYNDPSRTARGWCGGTAPNSNTKRYWLREDPTPVIDVWGDPPLSDDYASLQFRQKDNHYGEHYRFLNAGPGYTSPPSGPDKNFDESAGIDYYYGWSGDMGGYEPYFFQIYPQINNVKDTIWANYKTLLTGNPSPPDSDKEVYIRLTQGVDYQFSEDPTAGVCEENGGGTGGTACFSDGDCNEPDTCDLTIMPQHGQSLYDGIIDLIDNVGVDKIIISEHFVGHSRMMNEDMGRMSAQHALEDSMDPSTPIIYAPDRILIGEVDYPRVDADYVGNYIVGGHYTFDEVWTGPAYVAGNFFNNTLSDCLANNTVAEINALITGGAGDIAVFLSGHGTSNTLSGAYDSLTDTPHFNTKVWFIDSVRKIVLDLGGNPSTIVFGPDTVSNNEVNYAGWYENLKSDGSSSMDIISRSIKHATVTVNGRNYKFYRVYGQYGYTEQGTAGSTTDNCLKEDPAGAAHPCGPDPHDLVYSAREALLDVVSLNKGSGNYSDVLDHLRAFFGDSVDLLQEHRFGGYGEALGYCNAGKDGADVDRCKDQKLLYNLANLFPNPGVHETSDTHHVSNYLGTTCQEGSGIPSYDPADWVQGRGVYDETHQFNSDCYRSTFSYKGVKVHITNATYCFDEKEQAVEENIKAALDDAAGDNDGIPTAEDNCPSDHNPNQEDGDCDGIGDACDESTDCTVGVDCDDDCDGFYNQNDNCQYFWNPSQADNDSDGIGNGCDSNTDSDGDGYGDTSAYENTCNRMWMANEMPMGKNICDNCPDTYNPNQKDSDRDGLGDCCDPSPGCGGNGEPTCDSYCEAPTTTTTDTTTTTIPCSLEAIYGEYSQKTELLRNFRDNVLSQSPEGQEIIRLYYEWSPMIVKAMEEDEEFKKGMKAMIDGVLLLIDNQVEIFRYTFQ